MIRFLLGAACGAFAAAWLIGWFLSSSREERFPDDWAPTFGSVDDLIASITTGAPDGTSTWHI